MATKKEIAAGFLFANPEIALVIAAVALIVFMLVGGLTLPLIFGMLTNPWMWIAAIILGGLAPAKSGWTLGLSIFMGAIFFGIQLYQEYQALQPICSIPILGHIACGGWNIITFIPKMIVFGETIAISFLMIWGIGYVKYQLGK